MLTCEPTRHAFLKLDEWRIYCRRCGEFRQAPAVQWTPTWVYTPPPAYTGGTWTSPNVSIDTTTSTKPR